MLKKLSLNAKLVLSYFALIICVLLPTFVYLWRVETTRLNEQINTTITNFSSILAKDPQIINSLEQNIVDDKLSNLLYYIIEIEPYVDFIVVANNEDIRLFHPLK